MASKPPAAILALRRGLNSIPHTQKTNVHRQSRCQLLGTQIQAECHIQTFILKQQLFGLVAAF